MTGNELLPGEHLGGSEEQRHNLELRKVRAVLTLKPLPVAAKLPGLRMEARLPVTLF